MHDAPQDMSRLEAEAGVVRERGNQAVGTARDPRHADGARVSIEHLVHRHQRTQIRGAGEEEPAEGLRERQVARRRAGRLQHVQQRAACERRGDGAMPLPAIPPMRRDGVGEKAAHLAPAFGLRARDMNAAAVGDGDAEAGAQDRCEAQAELACQPPDSAVVGIDELASRLRMGCSPFTAADGPDAPAQPLSRLDHIDCRTAVGQLPRGDKS